MIRKSEHYGEKVPEYYIEGAAIEAKINLYKSAKKRVTDCLLEMSHLISKIEGKLEEVDTVLGGDRRLEVTLIRFYLYASDFGYTQKEVELTKKSVELYNAYVKNEEFALAKKTLLELKEMLLKFREEKARMYYIADEEMEKKAHTPIVIREKKRKNDG